MCVQLLGPISIVSSLSLCLRAVLSLVIVTESVSSLNWKTIQRKGQKSSKWEKSWKNPSSISIKCSRGSKNLLTTCSTSTSPIPGWIWGLWLVSTNQVTISIGYTLSLSLNWNKRTLSTMLSERPPASLQGLNLDVELDLFSVCMYMCVYIRVLCVLWSSRIMPCVCVVVQSEVMSNFWMCM